MTDIFSALIHELH